MTSDERRLVGGRYRLDRRIGSGAMGVVWQAYDERLRRAVAVKQLRLDLSLDPADAEEARQRAMREGRIAARLHHPNAVSVFDVVDEDDAPWLVMEYVPSRSLAAEMQKRRLLPPEEVGRIGAQVAHALVAAHAAGIVHRDIKPANVLLGDDGIVKITDFGISRATGDVAVTKTGLIAGTPAYLAPEVAYGRDPAAPSDVFSLGSTLYAAVEGQPPFGLSENTLSLLHTVAAGRINPPRRAGILTDALVHLLNPDPDTRPTAATAAWWLDAVARGSRPDIAPISPDTFAGMSETTRVTQGLPLSGLTARTRPVTGQYGSTGTRPGMSSVRRPGGPPPSRRNRRPMVLAGIGIAAVLLIGGIMLANGVFDSKPSGNPPQVNSGPTTPNFQQIPLTSTDVPTFTTVPTHTKPPVTTTTTTTVPPTTTTTTTAPPTTTTAPPTTTTAAATSSPAATGGAGNVKP
ncbi:MAG TPA: serine/threonine-protein kinase [Pseudonocardiaceae bacterium]|nr:serine/threonine-protein kinase [Pseudonocardiaceae bacterium]